MEGGQPTVIPNQEGNRTTPSVVAFTKGGDGWLARSPSGRPSPIPRIPFSRLNASWDGRYEEVSEEMKDGALIMLSAETTGTPVDNPGKEILSARDIGDDPDEAQGKPPKPTWGRR